jgi:hypothetical protein
MREAGCGNCHCDMCVFVARTPLFISGGPGAAAEIVLVLRTRQLHLFLVKNYHLKCSFPGNPGPTVYRSAVRQRFILIPLENVDSLRYSYLFTHYVMSQKELKT